MNATLKPYFIKFNKLVLSYFGTGYFPKAPGTFGSIATLPLIFYFFFYQTLLYQIIFICILTLVSILMAQYIQKAENLKDPQWIVIDEVIGMLITSLAMNNNSILQLTLVLLFFRFFDIIKFWPASYFDKLNHGAGTIMDDVVSGIYSYILVRLVNNFI